MTQDEVVAPIDAVGHPLTKGVLSKYERGGSVPKPTTLRALGKVLWVPTDSFPEEEEAKVGVEWLGLGRRFNESDAADAVGWAAHRGSDHRVEPEVGGDSVDHPPRATNAKRAREGLRGGLLLGEVAVA